MPQTNHAGLLGSSYGKRHLLSGNLRLPVRRTDPVLFYCQKRVHQRQGDIRPLIFTSYGSSFPFFWTPCGPSGFGFTEQSSKGSSICPVGYSLPTTIRSIGALCAGALSDFTTVPTGKRGASLCFLTLSRGGSGENRTHGRLSTHGGFQDRCLKPLGHASLS